MAKGSGLFHNARVESRGDSRTSASQNTSVGSGSRPTRSRIPIEDSAPRAINIPERKTSNVLK